MPENYSFEIFAVVVAFAAFIVVRLLRVPPRYRREASKILIISGAVAAGTLSGFLRVQGANGFSELAGITALAVFFGTAAVALFCSFLPGFFEKAHGKRAKKDPEPTNGPNPRIKERHDYTNVG